ncbi:MAG: hypothetical protein IPQ07_12150 [Myxococcales bacterium]|nr:hypothetical protein [Myxococcales bacterium]
MRLLLVGALVIGSVAACKGKERPSEKQAPRASGSLPAGPIKPADPTTPPDAAPAPSTGDARMTPGELLAQVRGHADRICACTDPQCITTRTQELITWSQSAAHLPTAADSPELAAQGARIQKCIDARGKPPVVLTGFPDAPATPVTSADQLVRHTFDGLTGFAVARLELAYIPASGVLDPTYSKATVSYGTSRALLEDDPRRPLGAPVPDPEPEAVIAKRQCPEVTWRGGARSHVLRACQLVQPLPHPRCTVVEIWKQAIAKGAPPEALAVLSFRLGSTPQAPPMWGFTIDDAPRKVHFVRYLPDACELAVEKPQ